ncbi:MAG: beta-ketoacyl-ACP synthase II [Bacteroidales bacterium]|nr:beta-ketoacyl-ACP synthase II [Bacteroidales bacterium]MBQ6101283.1 beta-ketoacyl-ACP synthase II [Bacteroidales bacterium]
MESKRVVVTGLGAITPVGNTVKDFWSGLISGKNGVGPITHFDSTNYKTRFAAEVKDFDPLNYFDRKDVRKYDPFAQFALIAAQEAVESSHITPVNTNFDEVGVVLTAGIGGVTHFFHEVKEHVESDGTPRFSPYYIPKMILNIPAGVVSIKYGFRGPNFATVSACASSSHAIVSAFDLIRYGKAVAVLAGGAEAGICEAGIGGFNAMHALSLRNDDPQTASRPFDKNRDGFVMGEGGGCLMLEELEHALKRGADIYAELVGVGMSGDAYHITAPHPEGYGAALSMERAIKDAGIEKTEIEHINTHGTSTPQGDIAEIVAVQKVFGEHSYNINLNSTKSMTGHLLGGTGAVEAIATILALREGIIPPTINHFEDDPQIDPKLDFTFNTARKRDIRYALSNAFGFGGQNTSLLFKKYTV